jgi:Flagellar hook-length control protein FliK
MRLDLVNFRGASPTGLSASLLSEWRVGAILQAVAVRDAKGGQLWLDIGGQRYPARVASGDGIGPQAGEKLQVRVLRDHPVLALETLSSSVPGSEEVETAAAADALRRFVPRQQSPAPLLANLAWLTQGKNGTATLPKAVVQAAAKLWQALPSAGSLTEPATLQSAVARSGTFLETNLAQAAQQAAPAPNVATDLKALMLALNKALQDSGARPAAARADTAVHSPIPHARGTLESLPAAPATFSLIESPEQQLNELARQADGALARLTTTQIASTTPDPSSAVQSMLIELPVRHEDRASVLRLRIERDRSRRALAGGDSWTVEAAMDLGQVGALHAKVSLTGRRIGVQLRAESPAIVEALSMRAGELESVLRESGLEVERVVCLHGMPAGDAGARPTRLLDVRA